MDEEPLFQAFRSRSTDCDIKIKPHKDSKSGEHIVLWSDIQQAFKNAMFIRNDGSLVSFLKDDNFEELIPQRIAYYPGVVLEVVVEDSKQDTDFTKITPMSRESRSDDNSFNTHSNGSNTTNMLNQNMSTLTLADINTNNQSFVVNSDGKSELHPALREYKQLYHSYFQVIMSGEELQAASIKQSIDKLVVDMEQNKTLQEQLIVMQQEMQLMEKQTFEQLAILQGRVHVLLTHTYDKCPIPKLFIILPKEEGALSGLYRLYFLCECGTHTMAEHNKTPPPIHLAKHEGYDLDKPTEFFERYRSYIMTMMYMVKFGITTDSLIVPPLSSLGILEGLDNTQEHVKYLRSNITPLVDNIIRSLQGYKNDAETTLELPTGNTDFGNLESLGEADLRQLESYLKVVKDQGSVLGNLYRIVTPEGNTKWVCFDHYCANYRESVIQQLRDIVKVNYGRFIEETGRIEIKIGSSILAKQFYNVMVKASWIQELDITLRWDATMDDFQLLAETVTKANVIRLTIDGTHFKNPILDVINRGRRFDPILQLASNTVVQSLQLKGFNDFYSRTSKSSWQLVHQFRVFSMKMQVDLDSKAMKLFKDTLKHCAALTALDLKIQHQYSVAEATSNVLSSLQKLESLKITSGRRSFTASVSQGKIQDIELKIERLDELDSDEFKFIRKQHLTRLAVMHTPDQDLLMDILRLCPRLSHLQIGCKSQRLLALTNRLISTRESILQEQGSCCLRTVEVMEEELRPFDTLVNFVMIKVYIQYIISFAEDSNSFDMRTWIRLGVLGYIHNAAREFIRQYGWSIVFLDQIRFEPFAEILEDIPSTRTSQLESFHFYAYNFPDDGLDRLNKIIKRSPNFKDLGLEFYFGEECDRLETALLLFSRYGTILSSLELGGMYDGTLERIAELFPSRDSFPNLVSLDLDFSRCGLSSHIPWILAMISSSPQTPTSSSSDLSLSRNILDKNSIQKDSETTVSWTKLRKLRLWKASLQTEEWKQVIEAVDFSVLEHLYLRVTKFSRKQLKLLIDRIPVNNISEAPLKVLKINYTPIADSILLRSMVADLRKKVPLIDIHLQEVATIGYSYESTGAEFQLDHVTPISQLVHVYPDPDDPESDT
ncbi:hypothetical protein BGZ65_002217 [Modicella reniformis]|uniref:Uncharacterized protein n=1 Tax=Modicella reniformis TaxID=1440133 RepID=A0A9P6J0T6_9FUNG|nr:hypothetical protein BGZ65_002217 [Modicella reniformis]